MLRPIVIAASLLTVIGAQISVLPSGTGTLTPGQGCHQGTHAYGADFLYEARTTYHFSADLVPGFIAPGSGGSPACIWREGFRTARDPEKAFANLLSREGPSTYRVSIGDRVFDGRIESFAGEGTLYRNLVAEGTQDCSQNGR